VFRGFKQDEKFRSAIETNRFSPFNFHFASTSWRGILIEFMKLVFALDFSFFTFHFAFFIDVLKEDLCLKTKN
jgi:hypothetical protein